MSAKRTVWLTHFGTLLIVTGVILLYMATLDILPRHPGWLLFLAGLGVLYLVPFASANGRRPWEFVIPAVFGLGCWLVLSCGMVGKSAIGMSGGLSLIGLGSLGLAGFKRG